MLPDGLRCESRRPGGMGLWRYSIAAMIVFAAMLDVIWWVPMHQPTPRRDSLQATMPQCRKLQLERELEKLQVAIDALSAELDAVEAQLRAVE